MRADTSVPTGEKAAGAGLDRLSLLWLASLAFGILSFVGGVLNLLIQLHAMPGVGDIGTGRFTVETGHKPGYVVLNSNPTGSPLARAGVSSGSDVAFDRPVDAFRILQAGEQVGLTVDRGGRPVHFNVVAEPVLGAPFADQKFDWLFGVALNQFFPSALGLFVIFRARGNLSATLLGLGYSALSATTPAMIGPVSANQFQYLYIPARVATGLANLAFVSFAMTLGRPFGWRFSRIHWMIFAVSLILSVGSKVSVGLYYLNPGPVEAAIMSPFLYLATPVMLFIYAGFLLLAWRSSPPPERARQSLFFVAMGLGGLGVALSDFPLSVLRDLGLPPQPLRFFGTLLSDVVATSLGSYAILRHRILDIGFAVNRTLIYGAVSAILLVLFGLIEWSVDHFVPIEGREKNVIVDAVVAVGVFLTFHRVRDAVEHAVKAVFFERWQKAEAALRRFVHEAAFVKSRDALIATFVEAISKYADGADAAIYLAAADGYQRAGGALAGVEARIDIDDPLLVALRADPRAFEVGDTRSKLGATLAAPLINRNEVIGVVLVGAKPAGVVYRPDEIALIGWASRQIGYDLHALKVEALEANDLRKSGEIALLNARIEGLLAGRPAG